MKKNKHFTLLVVLTLLFFSCTSSDSDSKIVIESITPSKTISFTNEFITLDIEGKGYTDVIVNTTNTKVVIKKITTTRFEVRASEATNAILNIELISS